MRMNVCGIYKITSPTKKVYIGQSVNIRQRLVQHKHSITTNSDSALCRSFKKYGFEKHKVEVLCECIEQDLNEKEAYYIDLFNSFSSEFGLNARGGGGSRGRASEETKLKLSISHKGKVSPKKGKKYDTTNWKKGGQLGRIPWNKGLTNIYSEETRAKMSKSALGATVPEERRRKISETMKGSKQTAEHIRNAQQAKLKNKN